MIRGYRLISSPWPGSGPARASTSTRSRCPMMRRAGHPAAAYVELMTDADRSRPAGLREAPARRPAAAPAGSGHDRRFRHHAVCRECGAVTDVSVTGLVPGPPPAAGAWTLGEAVVTFWGRCARCRGAEGGATPH